MTHVGSLMAGKRGLIMGLANNKSLAWGIAQALKDQGAELAFTYQGEGLKKRVIPLADSLGFDFVTECDVSDQSSIDAAFSEIEKKWGKLDFLVHSIGYSDKNELTGRYIDTSPENFAITMNISCFSFTSVAKRAASMMEEGGTMLTLSYYGAEKVVPHYNVMGVAKAALEASVRYLARDLGPDGIRVNSISAGPIKTLAASGVSDFRYLLKFNEINSPLKKTVTIEEVGGSALYLLSSLSGGVTGENLHVDAGYHIVGIPSEPMPAEFFPPKKEG
jgi:enoyl-[acyl-carrier protein] reductase I